MSSGRNDNLLRTRSVRYRKIALEMEGASEYDRLRMAIMDQLLHLEKTVTQAAKTTSCHTSCYAMQSRFSVRLLPNSNTKPISVSIFTKHAVVFVGRPEPLALHRIVSYVVLSAGQMLTAFVNIAALEFVVNNCVGTFVEQIPPNHLTSNSCS